MRFRQCAVFDHDGLSTGEPVITQSFCHGRRPGFYGVQSVTEPLSIDLTHDAEYGAALVDETHRGQLARNLPQRPSVTLGGSTGERFAARTSSGYAPSNT